MTDGGAGPRIALVGCGRWGAHVLRDLRTLGCHVTVLARSSETAARAREGGADGVVGSLAELPEVDGAVIVTTATTHAHLAETLLAERGVPVFVEKPLSDSVADAQRLADLYEGRLFVMDKWRYHPGVRELARIAHSGELGPVSGVHARRVTAADHHDDVDTVWTHAPHDLAIALEVLGHVPPALHAVAEWSRGERVGLFATLGGPPWLTLEVSCVAPAHRRELRLVCEHGAAQLDGGWSQAVTISRGQGVEEERPTRGELPLLAELRAFVGHIEGGPPPKSGASEGALIVSRIHELGDLAQAAVGEPLAR